MNDWQQDEQKLPAFTQPRSILVPVDQRANEVYNVEQFAAQMYRATFDNTMVGSGELIVDLVFPVQFSEKPIHWCSGELAPNQPTAAGSMPVLTVVVLSWVKTGSLYQGAKVVFVATGVTGQHMIASAHFEGKAIRNPSGAGGSTGGGSLW